ncbi:5'-methylthioadenosine/S-adenosylhomocysteine nucleosidase [Aeromonas schubertii]|nr:5'-methylthioadenosine/S-adenosylhomocysteine nucleosidase [Aeromonas schubertii]
MKVGIIGAMEQEVALLRGQMEGLETLKVGGCEFYSGKLAGRDVVLTRSGIGKVAASVATTLLIEKFAPDCVINTGSAGGFAQDLHIGDVVIASEMRFHDVDVTAFGYEPGQMAQQPAAFPCDEKLMQLAADCIGEQGKHQTKMGLICTGDQFMCKSDAIAKARADFPQMLAVEMEGAAIGQVCHQFAVPYLVVRAMSDIAGKEQVESFDAFIEVAGQHSAEVILAMLTKL